MKRITSLAQLIKAREQRRAVICPGDGCLSEPMPAAWVANYPGEMIHRLISSENGMFVYEKQNNTKRKSIG